ncbi:MAG: hypothetical protein RL148_2920 [Planctomycetota bacterium]
MKPSEKFAPYDRKAFLATVPAAHRAIATKLCNLLEAYFETRDITIYSGFPIVVRDGEWTAGFAIRSKGPMVYCCSPRTLAVMGKELAPLMSGKSCLHLRPVKGLDLEAGLALVAKAFGLAARHGGMISKADARKRDAAKARAGATTGQKKAAARPTRTKTR